VLLLGALAHWRHDARLLGTGGPGRGLLVPALLPTLAQLLLLHGALTGSSASTLPRTRIAMLLLLHGLLPLLLLLLR
jgi:hypothetical protein